MVKHNYPSELQLVKTNDSDAEASFLNLLLSISDGFFRLKFMKDEMTLILIL